MLTGFVDPVTGTESFPYHSYEKIIDYDYKDNTCTTYAIQKLIIFFFCIFSIVNERVNEYKQLILLLKVSGSGFKDNRTCWLKILYKFFLFITLINKR